MESRKRATFMLIDYERENPGERSLASRKKATSMLVDNKRENPGERSLASQKKATSMLVDNKKMNPGERLLSSRKRSTSMLIETRERILARDHWRLGRERCYHHEITCMIICRLILNDMIIQDSCTT